MKDTITTGVVAGLLATLLTAALEGALSLMRILPPVTYQYIARLILPDDLGVPPAVRVVTVLTAGATASASFGTLMAVILRLSSREYWLLKGVAFGGALFIIHVSLIPKLWEPGILPLLNIPGIMYREIIDKLLWGAVSAALVVYFSAGWRVHTPANKGE